MIDKLPANGPRQGNGGRLVPIEVARGCAASVVVLYHCIRHVNAQSSLPLLVSIFQFGHAGVDLFFVISGFIITHVHVTDIGRPARFGAYIRRRFQRVYPMYWIATGLALLITSIRHPWPQLSLIAASATLDPFTPQLIVGVAWTLQFEVVFYLIFGLCILNRRIGVTIAGMWLLLVVAGLAGVRLNLLPPMLISSFNLEFMLGVIGAVLFHRKPGAIPGWLLPVGLGLLALVALAEGVGRLNGYGDLARIAYGAPSLLIVLGAAKNGVASRNAAWPILRSLGAASYSIYLFQLIFVAVAWQVWRQIDAQFAMPPWVAFPFLAISAILGGVVVSRHCEYPLLRLMRRRTG